MAEDHRANDEEKYSSECGEGDHHALVEVDLVTVGRPVLGTKVRLIHCNIVVLLGIFHRSFLVDSRVFDARVR